MNSLAMFIETLFDPTGFVPRAVCGRWTPGEILLNNISDLFIALAYVSIPIMLMIFARKQRDFPFSWLSVVFAAFILTCGSTHVMEIILFYYPIYHLAGWVKAVTAVASWVAVIALYKVLPQALALHSPADLQAAKDQITASHQELEIELVQKNATLAETNRRLESTLQELREANEVKSRFLANLSHELRTPMVGIIGLAELALEDDAWNVRDSLAQIRRSAESLDTMLADLLEFSKIEAGKLELRPRSFRLGDLQDNIVSTLTHFAKSRRLELRADTSETLLQQYLCADMSRLQHVLVNLTQNALKFTDEGYVLFHVEQLSETADELSLRFSVRDTGVGISAKKLPAIFEPFSQVDDSLVKREAGSGLGLAICNEMLDLMGTKLEVESAPGQGSMFWFDIRLEKAEPPGPLQQETLSVKKGRILLIEDNPINRAVMSKILTNAGHTVVTAATGAEALALLEQQAFDLALVDLQLPDIDGISIAQEVRSRGCKLPLWALTAHGEESYRQKAIEAGMSGFLVKPIPTHELLSQVSRSLEEHTSSS